MIRAYLISLSLVLAIAPALAAQDRNAGKGGPKPAAGNAPAKSKAAIPGKPAGPSTDKSAASSAGKSAAADDEKPSGDSATEDPAVTEFNRLFADWKELHAKLEDLRKRYIVTPRKGGLRDPLKKDYAELVKEGEKLEPKMIEAAEAAFAVVGNDKPEVGKFLATYLKYDVEHDDYERAVPIARALIDNSFDNPRVYNYGGIGAYMTEDFDDAEKWLKEGDKHSVLDVEAKQSLAHIGQAREKWEKEAGLREKEKKADDLPRVLLKTTKGDITIELFENEAPNTVANFISLVEKKFYDGVTFHRVLPHFMAQGGDPQGDGKGGPGYNIPDETDRPDHREHFRGSLSMANTGRPDTGGSQFFLCFVPIDHLDGKHTVFGRVIEGIGVLAQIQRIDPDKPVPGVKPDKIVEASVLRKRKHAYEPKKTGEVKDGETADER